jgi:hypothetical protein
VDGILAVDSKPTPLEIAAQRHAARTPEQIADLQSRWAEHEEFLRVNMTPQYSHIEPMSNSATIDKIRELTGCDYATAERYKDAVKTYTGRQYIKIRQYQNGDTSKFDSFELKEYKQLVNDLEEYIRYAPQWEGGETYRGIAVSQDVLDKIIAELEQGEGNMLGSTSWSTSRDMAKAYANNSLEAGEKDKKVLLVANKHTKATSIKYLSKSPYEQEVLAAKWCRYKLVRQYTEGDYIILEVEPSTYRGTLF